MKQMAHTIVVIGILMIGVSAFRIDPAASDDGADEQVSCDAR